MKYLAPIFTVFGLVCFTAPDGQGVWLQSEQIVSVGHAADCGGGSNAKISSTQGSFCVHETPQEALKKLDPNNARPNQLSDH